MFIQLLISKGGLGTIVSGLLEGLGIPWPGAVVITAAGTEFAGVEGAMWLATLFAVTYTASSAIQYAVGRYCRRFLERFLSEKIRAQLDQAIHKYGQAAVLWTRPLAVGNYISIPAGMMRMNPAKFLLYTFVGIWPWAFGMAMAGGIVSRILVDALPALAAALALLALAGVSRRLVQRSRSRHMEESHPA
ncbi:MAG TPA: VTT domain-containing protein [Symbiobacteriaceae bacterium]|nr:VTT domain-containing protein [Symbiobacteriaceae bacterium]